MSAVCIPGNPVPKARPRMFHGHAVTPKRTRDYEKTVALLARAAGVTPIDGPVKVTMWFYRDSAHRCDLDNLCKSILDGLNTVGFHDDNQIVHIEAHKGIDRTHPRAVVEISAAKADDV